MACPDEAAFCSWWHSEGLGMLRPVPSAFRGGVGADRLSWVFVSGYQAAMRYSFPELDPSGWAALAASEDHKDPVANPPSVLKRSRTDADLRLVGTKSWVAQSRAVQQLVVTARPLEVDSKEPVLVRVGAHARGVVLTHREAPTFLRAMSQGFARFDSVRVGHADVLPSDRLKWFARAEAILIMLAATGYLLKLLVTSPKPSAEVADAAELARELAQTLADQIEAIQAGADPVRADEVVTGQTLANRTNANPVGAAVLAAADRDLQQLVVEFERLRGDDFPPDWHDDRRLLSMYSKGIQRRAARDSA